MIQFSTNDLVALAVLIGVWVGLPLATRLYPDRDLSAKLAPFREFWTLEMLHRSERITDVGIARSMLTSVSFFATTTVFLIGGIIGIIGSADKVVTLMLPSSLFVETSRDMFEIKAGVLLLLFVQAFFKFGWSMRLHAYSTVLIGAAPQPEQKETERARKIALKAARMSTLASSHYADGLRAYYLGLAVLAWFVHPILMQIALAITVLVLVRREYFSNAAQLLELDEKDTYAEIARVASNNKGMTSS